MTGMSRAACTIAQAIRCVKESLRPASLSAARREARVSTSSVRKLVAVGIERLSFMKRASVAAGPRMGVFEALRGARRGLCGLLAPRPLTGWHLRAARLASRGDPAEHGPRGDGLVGLHEDL